MGDDFRHITDSIYDGLDRFIEGAGRLIGVDTGPTPETIRARVVAEPSPALAAGRAQLALPAIAGASDSTAMTVAEPRRSTGIPAFAISEDRRRGTFMVGNGVQCQECPTWDFAVQVRDMLNAAIGAKS